MPDHEHAQTEVRGETRHFFDAFPRFHPMAKTSPPRLNHRYDLLIGDNRHLIAGKRVLDVASNNGLWSFAALQAGASYVLGIEGREDLANYAHENMEAYGIRRERYDFAVGDVHTVLKDCHVPFDVVFCFGFLYHTPFHMQLLTDLARLTRQHMIIDTNIALSPHPIASFSMEDVSNSRLSIDYAGRGDARAVVGVPSASLLNMILGHLNFDVKQSDWHARGIGNWTGVTDYQERRRITLVAAKKHGSTR